VGDVYTIDLELLVGAGFAVVSNNFRGSAGYGEAFARRIAGDWGRKGSLDHHATLKEVVKAGIADPERLGVYGLSHGGFAACWLVSTSSKFKAAVAENPISSFQSWFGAADTDWWFRGELGGSPNEIPDVYRSYSPLTYSHDCATPTLLIVGEHDLRCPPAESEQFYRELKANGCTTAMLRLPNAGHMGSADGPVPARLAQNEALVAWFRRHLSAPED
jgi:dipeptidyl aminopeptidase/acylaminoacyl peptidase